MTRDKQCRIEQRLLRAMSKAQNDLTHVELNDTTSKEDITEKKYVEDVYHDESFQLHMGFSFPFLCANNLRLSLFIMRTRSF